MPGPPPPPPAAPPPMMPPPAAFTPSKGGPDNRSALLSSIRQGARLGKTVTGDKSAPIISGKVSNSTTNNSSSFGASNHSSPGAANHSSSVTPTPNGLPLGGLFAGGMPKLRPTGKLGTTNSNSQSNGDSNNHSSSIKQKQDIRSPTSKSFSSIQSELKKQMASDNRNRGPPPPAPVRQGIDNSTTGSHQSLSRVKSHEVNSASQLNLSSSLQMNTSTLHRKVKSNTNLSLFNGSSNGHNPSTKPVINHGKPNLAPKPPNVANGKTPGPPKKLITNGKLISRAQSMRTPRSPSPQSPDADMNAIKFGTVRNLSSVIGKSLGSSTGNLAPRPRPALNGRPTVPPPLVPPAQPPPPPPQQFGTPPPPSKVVKPPSEAPPPPPTHAPPPPPHRTHPARPPPAVPNSTAPPPPPRHSSMTTPRRVIASDLEDRFKFNPVSMFPKPPVYRNVTKVYSNRQAASKQQAPQPPRSQPSSSSNRSWDVQSSC